MARRFYGIILYGHDWSASGSHFLAYCNELASIEGLPPLGIFLADLIDRKRRRYHQWNKSTVSRLNDELRDRRISWMLCADQKDEQNRELVVWTTFDDHKPIITEGVNFCATAFEVKDRTVARSILWKLIDANGRLALSVNAPYGCVVFDESYKEIVGFASGFGLHEAVQSEFAEFGYWHAFRNRIDRQIRGAYWGNYLSVEHVSQLGGEEKLQGQSFVSRCLPFNRRLWFVSVTDEIADLESGMARTRLAQLAQFLAPIGVPRLGEERAAG